MRRLSSIRMQVRFISNALLPGALYWEGFRCCLWDGWRRLVQVSITGLKHTGWWIAAFFPGTCHWNSVSWGRVWKDWLVYLKKLISDSQVYSLQSWSVTLFCDLWGPSTSSFRIVRLRGWLLLLAGSLESLHLMGTYASGYFKCNPSACPALVT